jgi:transcriptional regulator with XRE-family HTH domain
MGSPAPGKRVPVGPVGRRVIANVRLLRSSAGITYKDLSDRLAALGQPIPVLGLSRLERGERRVDVDDLVALAEVLGVTTTDLLFAEAQVNMHKEGS